MVDDHELVGPQELRRDDQGPDGIIRSPATRIPNDVGISYLQAKELRRMKTGIHAGQNNQMPCRRHRQISLGETLRKFPVCLNYLVSDRFLTRCHDTFYFDVQNRRESYAMLGKQ
jgi:hypothetical protein